MQISDFSTKFSSNFYSPTNYLKISIMFIVLRLWHFTSLRYRYSKCSKWRHSARVAAASRS